MRSLGSPDEDDDDEEGDDEDEDDEDVEAVDVPPDGVVLPPLNEDLKLHAATSARTRTHEDLRMADDAMPFTPHGATVDLPVWDR
jgi:hypothetical protein